MKWRAIAKSFEENSGFSWANREIELLSLKDHLGFYLLIIIIFRRMKRRCKINDRDLWLLDFYGRKITLG